MPKMPSAARVPQLFSQIWHLPDTVHWMDPLPPFHRRGIILAIVIILVAFLWPYPAPLQTSPSIPTRNPAETHIPIQAELNNQQSVTTPASQSAQSRETVDSAGQWRNYQIASGQTLAQLFRDNNLPVTDVFTMAQAEGDDKPLSHLQAGQEIKVRLNTQGVVTGLTLDTGNGQILFTRQPDGSFLRVR